MSNQYSGELKMSIMEAAKRPDGMSSTDIHGYTVKQVGRMLQKLQSAGLIVRAPMPGKFGRYFDTLPRAEDYASRHAPTQAVTTAKPTRWASDVESIVPDGVKRTIQNAPPPRFAPDPEDKSWRMFGACRLGDYPMPATSCAAKAAG